MMSFREVGELLKIAQRFDKRTATKGDVEAWCAALNQRGLEFHACAEAIVTHYAREDTFITVARIAEIVNRPKPRTVSQAFADIDASLEPPFLALEPPREMYEEAREIINAIARPAGAQNAPFRYERGHPAMAERCPWCQARPGNWCYKIIRRRPTPQVGFLHPSRVEQLGLPYTPIMPKADS